MSYTFNIFMCDDNEDFLWSVYEKVQEIMDKNKYSYNIYDFTKGQDLINSLKKNKADIILLDIDMPRISGFEAVEEIRKTQESVHVIFITNHSELAYQAYDYHPYQFVSKSDTKKLETIIPKLCDKIVRDKAVEGSVVIDFNGFFEVDVNSVMYVKAKRNYAVFCYSNGEERERRGKITDVYALLKKNGFIFAQRSYVINCRFIYDFDITKITLKNGEKISVTRDFDMRREAQQNYGAFMRSLRW